MTVVSTISGGAGAQACSLSEEWHCLQAFVEQGSQSAFRTLVDSHSAMVYSAALRQVRDKDLAQEVSQAVFILLARKAPALLRQPHMALGGWLHESTRLTAKNALRVQLRRQRHEEGAAREREMLARQSARSHPVWEDLLPILDEGLCRLSEKERAAIVLRFFEKRTLAETGEALGVSEDAAQMRVSRALDKLAAFISARQKVLPTATAVAGLIRANAVKAAPPEVASSIAEGAMQAVFGAAYTGDAAVSGSESLGEAKDAGHYDGRSQPSDQVGRFGGKADGVGTPPGTEALAAKVAASQELAGQILWMEKLACAKVAILVTIVGIALATAAVICLNHYFSTPQARPAVVQEWKQG